MAKQSDWNDDLKKLIEEHGEEEGRRLFKLRIDGSNELDTIDYLTSVTDLDLISAERKVIKELNAKHIFINNFAGKSCVTVPQYSEVTQREMLGFVQLDTFKNMYINKTLDKGKTALSHALVWLQHKERRTVDSVIFEPQYDPGIIKINGKDYLNLWEGFSVVPTKGSWYYTKRHIYNVICHKDKVRFRYIIQWLAWAVQNPDKQAEVAVALKGKKGSGKSFLFMQMQKIFGKHGMSVSDPNRLMGKHTGHFRLLSFLFCDEVYYPGDKTVEGRLKAIITQDSLDVEGKFQDAVTIKNRLHICMATNNERVILASADERRYYVDTISDRYAKGMISDKAREAYFDKLWTEMDNGGREAMLYDLQNIKLKGFHPRYGIPETEEMQKQKHLSLNAIEHAMRTMLDDGFLHGEKKVYSEDKTMIGYYVTMETISNYMERHDPYTLKFSTNKKADLIKRLGATKSREGGTGRVRWEFPELQKMRKHFDAEYGKSTWSNLDTKWTIAKSEF